MKTFFSALSILIAMTAGAAAESRVTFDQQGKTSTLVESIKTAGKIPAPAVLRAAGPEETPGFCIFNGRSGAQLGEDGFSAAVKAADVVYGGETHDQMKIHLAQLETLKALGGARGEKIVVGFEMLNMTLQPILDEYAAGRLTEAEFLVKADWQKEWGFDFNFYKPLFDYIRANKLKALALNLPKKVVSKIARVGLAGLSPEEKKYLPARVEITKNEPYIEYMRQTYGGHGKASSFTAAERRQMAFLRQYILGAEKAGMGDFTFENYLAAMCAWNETMGARLADFLNANPGFAGLVVVGSGHVIYNAGIPASVGSRTAGLSHASFYPQDAAVCPAAFPAEDQGLADYVWYIETSAPPARAKK